MTSIKLKHLDRFVDRQGRVRYYYRRGKGARIPISGAPGTAEFLESYTAASQQAAVRKSSAAPGTFDKLRRDYYVSSEYLSLAPSTRTTYRSVIG